MLRVVALMLAVAGSVASAQTSGHLGFRVDPEVAVRIHNLVGRVDVWAWDRDSIDVTASIEPGGGTLYGGGAGRLAKLGTDGQALGGTAGAELTVRVPRAARVWIKTASAPVDLQGLTGEVEVVSVLGAVTLTGSPRVATIETIDGSVRVEGDVTVLRIRTGGGRVEVRGARGDLAVTTVEGPVQVDATELLTARIESVSGQVTVAAAPTPGGRIDIRTHDGDVRVRLPRSAAARLDLGSVNGSIITRLGGSDRAHEGGSAIYTIGPADQAKRAGLVQVRTFKGTVRVDPNPEHPGGI